MRKLSCPLGILALARRTQVYFSIAALSSKSLYSRAKDGKIVHAPRMDTCSHQRSMYVRVYRSKEMRVQRQCSELKARCVPFANRLCHETVANFYTTQCTINIYTCTLTHIRDCRALAKRAHLNCAISAYLVKHD